MIFITLETKDGDRFPMKLGHNFFEGMIPEKITLPVSEDTWFFEVMNKDKVLKELQASGVKSFDFKQE